MMVLVSKGCQESGEQMPRITQEQKQLNHDRIVEAASAGFRARGVDAVGIDEVMREAGMTHGAFYNHFASKADLAVEVCRHAFIQALANVDAIVAAHPRSARAGFVDAVSRYLTAAHRDHPEAGCPSAAMVADAGRHGPSVQAEYERGLEGYLNDFSSLIAGIAEMSGHAVSPAQVRRESIAVFSQMVGAMMLARAVAAVNPALSDEVLETNRKQLIARASE
jgi:TetR/AcrR family transcriptional repressor of nem operon